MLTIALSHLLGCGVRLESHEAVALARELLAHPCGIPSLENIQLGSDGSASCVSTGGTPSVASIANLLLTLLPAGTPNVPAPLRYAIARGLEMVAAPPFASLDEFSSTLKRFEKGATRDVLMEVLQRGAFPVRSIAAPIAAAAPVSAPAAAFPRVAPQPPVVSPRQRRVVANSAAPSIVSPERIAAAPAMFRFFEVDGQGDSAVRAPLRWVLVAAVALVASFAVGFVVADLITDRSAATRPSASTPVSRGVAAPAANDANLAGIEEDTIVRVHRTPAVARDIVRRARRPGQMPRTRRAPVKPGEQVRARS
jgi:hypothetical protein